MRESLPIDKVLNLARAGESFVLDAKGCSLHDLVEVAAAAGTSKAKVCFRGLNDRSIEDLMRITVAGQGRVIFDRRADQPVYVPRAGWLKRRPVVTPRREQASAHASEQLQLA